MSDLEHINAVRHLHKTEHASVVRERRDVGVTNTDLSIGDALSRVHVNDAPGDETRFGRVRDLNL